MRLLVWTPSFHLPAEPGNVLTRGSSAANDSIPCLADAPLHNLPDMRLLPVHIQERIFHYCDLASQRTLGTQSSCFRPLWHKRRTAKDEAGKQRVSSACEDWRAQKMEEAARNFACKTIRAQVVKKHIHRVPEYHGSSTLHVSVEGHLDQRQLAYILQLQPDCLSILGFKIGVFCLKYAKWPIQSSDMDDLGESMFMSFKLSCRRQAGLSDDELERLEVLFLRLPECLVDLRNSYRRFSDVLVACEPMWRCSTSVMAGAAMRWSIPDEVDFTSEATDILV